MAGDGQGQPANRNC